MYTYYILMQIPSVCVFDFVVEMIYCTFLLLVLYKNEDLKAYSSNLIHVYDICYSCMCYFKIKLE